MGFGLGVNVNPEGVLRRAVFPFLIFRSGGHQIYTLLIKFFNGGPQGVANLLPVPVVAKSHQGGITKWLPAPETQNRTRAE